MSHWRQSPKGAPLFPSKVHGFCWSRGFSMHLCAKTTQLFQYLHRVLDRCWEAAAVALRSANTYLQSRKFSRRRSPAKTQGPAPVSFVLWNANVTSVAVPAVPSYFEARTRKQRARAVGFGGRQSHLRSAHLSFSPPIPKGCPSNGRGGGRGREGSGIMYSANYFP